MFAKLKDIDKVRDALRSEAKLEDIAKHYGVELRTSGNDDVKGRCPFHEEKTASFGIRKSKQLFHCFGCSASGDLFRFVELMDNCEHMESIRKIAEIVNFDLRPFKEAYTEAEKQQQELYNLNYDVMEFASKDGEMRVRRWSDERRYNTDIIVNAYGVGFTTSLEPENVPAATLEQGLALGFTEVGKWQNRLTIPLKDQYGRVAGFRNKCIDGSSQVKTIGPPREHPLLVPEIYGLHEARKYIRNAGFLILVEGEGDVWQMVGHGYRNVAAMMGTKLTESMMATIDSLSIPLVVVMADNDKAGRAFSDRLAETKFAAKAMIKIAKLEREGDPDEVLLRDGPDVIGETLANAKYAFEYLIERTVEKYDITRATEKLDVLTELRQYFVSGDDIRRELASRLIARLLDVDYTTVVDFFREAEAGTKADLHNVPGERAVLKRMLTDEEFVGEALLNVRSDDFHLARHRAVFDAVSKLYRSQQTVNESTVRTSVENATGETANSLLGGILADGVRADSAEFMLADLRDKSIRRNVQRRATDVIARLGDTSVDARITIQALSSDISNAVSGGGVRMMDAGEVVQQRMALMHERIKEPNAIIGLDMGSDFPVLNHTLHGLQKSRYIILSASAGTGKTAIAGALARRIAVELRESSLYCTWETGTEALVDRMVSSISGVESDKIVTGYISAEEAKLVHQAAALIAQAPLMVTERGIVFEEFAALVRHDVLKRGTRFVVADYLQLMTLSGADGRLRRDQELGIISRGMLELAKELDITLLVLAQQNRESAKSGASTKEGIGESYKIMQDCDAAIIFREKTSEEVQADGPDKGNRIATLAKHRHGKGGVTVNLIADLDVMRIKEYHGHRPPTH